MPKQPQSTILENWPGLKHNLLLFLSDTDSWIIAELKKATAAKDWDSVRKVVEVMESVHAMGHQH